MSSCLFSTCMHTCGWVFAIVYELNWTPLYTVRHFVNYENVIWSREKERQKKCSKAKDVTNNLVKLNECRFCCCLFFGIFRIFSKMNLTYSLFFALSKIFKFYFINLDSCASCSYVADILLKQNERYVKIHYKLRKLKWNVSVRFCQFGSTHLKSLISIENWKREMEKGQKKKILESVVCVYACW